MKKNEMPFDLDQLLRTVEHAGRDSRRQQQLSELIDRLAAEDVAAARHHRHVRWTIAFSAAACLLLFVSVFARMNVSGDLSQSARVTMTAQLDAGRQNGVPMPAEENLLPQSATPAPSRAVHRTNYAPVSTYDDSESALAVVSAEDVDDQTASPMQVQDDDIQFDVQIDTERPEEVYLAEQPAPLTEDGVDGTEDVTVVAVAMSDVPASEHHGRRPLIRLHRPEPSRMDGTTLAFRLL